VTTSTSPQTPFAVLIPMKHQTPMNLLIHLTTAIFLSPAYKPPLPNPNNNILHLKSLLPNRKTKIKRSVKVLVVNCRSVVDKKKRV